MSQTNPEGIALNPDAAKKFVFAGRADFAVVSVASDTRLTFRAKSPKLKEGETSTNCRFLYAQTGGEGRARWAYLGWTLTTDGRVRAGKSKVPATDTARRAIDWIVGHVARGTLPGTEVVEVFHCGRCGRCGRKLTDPVSIATGFGPHCTKEMGKEDERRAAKATVTAGKVRGKDAGTYAAAEDDKARREIFRRICETGPHGVDVACLTDGEKVHAKALMADGMIEWTAPGDRGGRVRKVRPSHPADAERATSERVAEQYRERLNPGVAAFRARHAR